LAQIFPRWTNKIPLIAALFIIFFALTAIAFVWYFGSPRYTDVGYRPQQPIPFSHKLHTGDLGMDCRYCHYNIERSPVANLPPTSVCLNCHNIIGTANEKLAPLRHSWAEKRPIPWVRVHKTPDYAYFNHAVHLNAGIGCSSCHGRIDRMDKVRQDQPLSMSWCLDCHRNPDPHRRPIDKITDMDWTPASLTNGSFSPESESKQVNPPTDCTGCHR